MISNKKVLLVCRESYAFPLYFIAEKMLEQKNQVGAFFVYPEESAYSKSFYNENTYYAFKERLPKVKTFGLEDFCTEYIDVCRMRKDPDLVFLKDIENEYTYFKNLNQQLLSSQSTSRPFHSRPYYKYSSQIENLHYLELAYRKVIDVLDEFKPDVILDCEDSELLRTVLIEVAYSRGIPYISLDYPRFEMYKIPTYSLGLKENPDLEEAYRYFWQGEESLLVDELAYINETRRNEKIMSLEFSGTITSKYKPSSLLSLLKFILIKAIYFVNVYIINLNARVVRNDIIIFTSPLKHFWFYLKVEIKKQYLYRRNRFFELPIDNEEYLYMPLHLIPESTTFVKAPFYVNELFLIEQISKSLPIGWKLYVKEHQAMIGERRFDFYRRIRKIHNVRLVQFNYYKDPKPWIEKSKGVITISGSSAYEAAILGKRSVIFGEVPFKLIEGVTKVDSFERLVSLFSDFGESVDSKSCAAYLAAVKSVGTEIDLKYLISESELIINGNTRASEKFNKSLDSLLSFYNRAFLSFHNHGS